MSKINLNLDMDWKSRKLSKEKGEKMEELIESILDYIRADYTDYAIMINGEWGSGKTYFWNNKVRKKIESLQLNGRKYTTIYMSLYGISNFGETFSLDSDEIIASDAGEHHFD